MNYTMYLLNNEAERLQKLQGGSDSNHPQDEEFILLSKPGKQTNTSN
jgi:hypothetical protein